MDLPRRPTPVSRRTFLGQTALAVGAVWAGRAAPARAEPSTALRTPEDRERSPFTGYARQHWLEIAERLLAGILPYLDRQTGMPELSGVAGDRGNARRYHDDPVVAKWQAMERIMMLAVYYTAATGRDRVPGWDGSISEVFRTGIRRMSDPRDPLYRPRTSPAVYLGSETALAAMLSPTFFWEPFSAAERERVLAFLEDLSRSTAFDNNHHLFHLVPTPLLERHGRPSNRAELTPLFERMLGWHRGGGWFIDGGNAGFDHYNFWGFQLYLNALFHLDPVWRRQFGERFRPVTAEFFRNARYFFGRDGGPIPWGRSLTYRFADIAAFGWASLAGTNPLPPGLSRRIASGCLKYFWDHGAQHENGVLESGYLQANAVAAEDYITDGTGYFAAQGFSCLLLPENDPFWTEKEQPMPADGPGGRVALPGAQMVVRVSSVDGEARLFPAGQPFGHESHWQRGVKYCQHAYSSYLGWCALGEGGEDLGAGRAGFSRDGASWTYRHHPVAEFVTTDRVASRDPMAWTKRRDAAPAPEASGEIVTHTLIGDAGEVHVFWHTDAQPIRLHLGGYGLGVASERELEVAEGPRRIHLRGGNRHSWMELIEGPLGRFAAIVLPPRDGWRHSHLFGGLGAFPYWRTLAAVASRMPVVIYVDGCRERAPKTPPVRVRRGDGVLDIGFENRTHRLSLLP